MNKTQSTFSLSFLVLLLADFLSLSLSLIFGFNALVIHGNYFGQWSKFIRWWSETGEPHFIVAAGFCAFCILSFQGQSLYTKRRPFWDELLAILQTVFKVSVLHGLVVIVSKLPFTRIAWLISWVAAAFLIPIFRALARTLLQSLNKWEQATVILGQGSNAVNVQSAMNKEINLGYKVTAMVQPGPLAFTQIVALKPKHLIIALDQSELPMHMELVNELLLRFRDIQFAPSLSGLPLFGMETHYFFSHEVLLLHSRNNLLRWSQRFLKRTFDIVATTFIVILISPLLFWITLRIRLGGGPAVFSHTRIGLKGQKFQCFKFRSMILDAEQVLKEILEKDPIARQEWNDKMKLTHDPRITKIGHFLRKSSLDELPQLWNVLRGDMSLVGPRPIVEKEISRYGQNIEFYNHVRPGLTGLWQVSGRSDTDYTTRVYFDTWYVKNWTLWNDIAILFKTIAVVLQRKGAY